MRVKVHVTLNVLDLLVIGTCWLHGATDGGSVGRLCSCTSSLLPLGEDVTHRVTTGALLLLVTSC